MDAVPSETASELQEQAVTLLLFSAAAWPAVSITQGVIGFAKPA